MFGIGTSELIVIFLIGLLVLGPDQLPKVARTLAKVFGDVKRASEDLRLNIVSIPEDISAPAKKKLPKAQNEPKTEQKESEVLSPQGVSRGSLDPELKDEVSPHNG